MDVKLPNGFNGTIYEEGGSVKDPFSDKEYEMTNIELSIFDSFSGYSVLRDMLSPDEMMSDERGEIEYSIAFLAVWFRENNPILFNDFICDFCDWDEEILTINSLSGDWSN